MGVVLIVVVVRIDVILIVVMRIDVVVMVVVRMDVVLNPLVGVAMIVVVRMGVVVIVLMRIDVVLILVVRMDVVVMVCNMFCTILALVYFVTKQLVNCRVKPQVSEFNVIKISFSINLFAQGFSINNSCIINSWIFIVFKINYNPFLKTIRGDKYSL